MPSNATKTQVGWSQAINRQDLILFDQHRSEAHPLGRPWWCVVEKQVNGSAPAPVGEIQPLNRDIVIDEGVTAKGWDAPWIPEQKYMTLAVHTMQGNRFRIDYQRMITDYREANLAYYRRANEEAAARNWPSVPLFGRVPFQLQSVKGIGAPPKSPKVPEAALAGDRWLLGFHAQPNEVLARILERDNGRGLAIYEDEIPVTGDSVVLSAEEASELRAFLSQRKQAGKMRAAKAAKTVADA